AVNDPKSPLHGLSADNIAMTEPGRIGLKNDKTKSDSYTAILRRAGKDSLAVESKLPESDEEKDQSFQSWGAHFEEVKINPLLPRVQVSRVVTTINCGRVVTYKPAHSQIIGGVVMGIGMALLEATE